ncbi:L,D-transpeptidase family protein [Marinicauda pacifica]|uniref:L,D-transpeptidase family protein n=1 Tax=Marinicauda pacifica TaxID=1133559 RepID=UPI0035C80984
MTYQSTARAFLLSSAAILAISTPSLAQTPMSRVDPEVQGETTGPDGAIAQSSVAGAIQEAMVNDTLRAMIGPDAEGLMTAAEKAYAIRVFDSIWDREGVRDLVRALEEAPRSGVYIAPGLLERVRDIGALDRLSDTERARADLTLTAAFLLYADARVNGVTDPGDIADAPVIEDTASENLSLWLAEAGEGLFDYSELDPDHDEFSSLRELRGHYRARAETDSWEAIDAPGELIEVGDEDAIVEDLRTRLAAEDYDVPDAPVREVETQSGATREEAHTALFTEELSEVLKAFQRDRGLKVDGIVGPSTLAELNATPGDLVDRIDANLERWRWAPERFAPTHVRVNIPAYKARAYEDGEVAVEMKAIVGRSSRQTPMLTDSLEYLVANPRWYVPESILERDKLDDIRGSGDYIESHDYFVLDRDTGERADPDTVSWDTQDVAEEYRLVQEPGEENALGELKFMFPNNQAIYLHGTPAQHLFDDAHRSFSSGCIRLAEPLRMSDWLASQDERLDAQNVRDVVAGQELERLELENPVPIHTVYFTATVDETGDARFHPDIYGWDAATLQAMRDNPVSFADQSGQTPITDSTQEARIDGRNDEVPTDA